MAKDMPYVPDNGMYKYTTKYTVDALLDADVTKYYSKDALEYYENIQY